MCHRYSTQWLVVLFGIAVLIGCDQPPVRKEQAKSLTAGGTGNQISAQQPQLTEEEWHRQFEEEEAKIVLPVDPRHKRLELTPKWLEGYWVSGKAACYGSDSGNRFNADSTYSVQDARGRYSISGPRVQLRVTENYNAPSSELGTSESFTVRLIGPNEIQTRWRDGGSGPLFRCPPEPLSA